MPNLRKPYLLFIGDIQEPAWVKTAFGLRDWARDDCLGQLRFNAKAVDLGLPEMSVEGAAAAGAKTMVIGAAPIGGRLPESWYATLRSALRGGLDIASGLHQRLTDVPGLAQCASESGRRLHDVRHSVTQFPVGTGQRRGGKRLLTVGTDCSMGKKYTALAIARGMRARGFQVDFRATGQTGILLAGAGVAVDAVVADFISGAAETLSPSNDPRHWDVIEGQGSLAHPGYAGVTLGLLHGSQPDTLVLCHDPSRKSLLGYPDFRIPPLPEVIDLYLRCARLTNPDVRFLGVSLNTSKFGAAEARTLLNETAEGTSLPCVDPIRTGVEQLLNALAPSDAS